MGCRGIRHAIKVALPPLEVDLERRDESEKIIGEFFDLTAYETRVMAVLMSTNRPMSAREICRGA